MPQLTAEDRTFLAAHLTGSLERTLAAISDLRPEQWNFKPDAETWSIAECADHIAAVERRVLHMVSVQMQAAAAEPERAAAVHGKERMLLKAVTSRERRVKVPVAIKPDGHAGSPAEFATHFREMREKTLDYVRGTDHPMHDRVIPHFVLEDLDGCQWLLMIALHTERHVSQMEEVKAHPKYPA